MKIISASYHSDDVEQAQWKMIYRIIEDNLPIDTRPPFGTGYEGLFPIVPEYFGMTRMYRNENNAVTFEFTDTQWTMFLLRWG